MLRQIFKQAVSGFSTSTKPIYPITVTDNAWNKFKSILKVKNTYQSFLFSAQGGGCNGFNYDLKLIDNETYGKLVKTKLLPTILKKDKISIVVDPMSEIYLLGTTIDYMKENFSKGVFENKFVFIPNSDLASTCGCGVSFSPKI
jgi:iron-sulfur cluster assembly accessory protein